MARRLKVFSWSDGLHDYTVAATSRARALAAWDAGRDLFKDGTAREAPEGPAREAALDAPETVVKRPAAGLDAALKAARPRRSEPAPDARATAAREARLARLKEELATLEAEARDAEADFTRRREALADEAARSRARFEARRMELGDAIEKARRSV